VIAAIMQRCHIVDMTITDPPMEEIIADIYGQKRATGHAATEHAGAKYVVSATETASSSTNAGG
jgi:ABC-2 type transport system ATP-binding protein